MTVNKTRLLKEFVELSWNEFNEVPETYKEKTLRDMFNTLERFLKKSKDIDDKKLVLIEEKNVLSELINLKISKRTIHYLNTYEKKIRMLEKLSIDIFERINFTEELKGTLYSLSSRLKNTKLEKDILMKILNLLKRNIRDYSKIRKNLKADNKNYIKIKLKDWNSEMIGLFYRLFKLLNGIDEKICFFEGVVRETKRIEKNGCYESMKDELKDLNYTMIQWIDGLILKINLKIKDSKNKKQNNENKKKVKRLLQLRSYFIKQIVLYWDKNAHGKKGYGTHEAEILDVEFYGENNIRKSVFRTNDVFIARIHYKAYKKIEKPMFGIAIYSESGVLITGPNTTFSNKTKPYIKGEGYVYFKIKKLPLLQGKYLFSASIYDYTGRTPIDHHHQEYKFSVVNDFSKFKEKYGFVTIEHDWYYQEKS